MGNTQLAVITKQIQGKEIMQKISMSLGKPATDPSVMRFLNGAIMYIQDKVGTKSDVTNCSLQSIANALINAALVKLPVDNRKLAYLVPFRDQCVFMPGFLGYIYKVKEADPTADITVGIVYKGDEFSCSKDSGNATYKHVVKNPFEDTPANIVGLYCFVKTATGSWIEVMSHKELMKVKAQSKMVTGVIWSTWELEMLKKSMVRRALKIKFNEAVAELDALDNKLFNERPAKIAPVLASEDAPLPEEKNDKILEAEVVGPEGEEKAPAAQEKAPEGTQVDTGDLQTMEGAIEKYHKPYKATAPHCWKMNGQLLQIFEKDNKTGADNTPIINTINEADKAMKNVKITYRPGSYKGKDGLEVKVLNIVNAYSPDKK